MKKIFTLMMAAALLLSMLCACSKGAEPGAGDGFYITEITDELFARIYGKSFKEDCTLPREDLRYPHTAA